MTNTFSSQIAPDDLLWTHSTDKLDDMESLFANPYEWIQATVGKELASHFVMQFTAFSKADPGSPGFVVQGINDTALITIRFDPDKLKAQLQAAGRLTSLDTLGSTLQVRLRTDFGMAYAHWEWGTNMQVVAQKLMLAASDTQLFLSELSALTQEVDVETGNQPPEPIMDVHVNFVLPPGGSQSVTFVYEGTEAWFADSGGEGSEVTEEALPQACNVDIGSFEGGTQAEMEVATTTIIVKAYGGTAPPPPA
jgi:hypothetical protein